MTYKKSLTHPKANAGAQQAFLEKIEEYERGGRPIIWIDESGFATDMPRTHGYSLRGERCFGLRNWHAKGRVNVIGALLWGVDFGRLDGCKCRRGEFQSLA